MNRLKIKNAGREEIGAMKRVGFKVAEIKKTTKYSAPALDKGLEILEYLSMNTVPCSQAEIAVGLGRTPNEIYRLLIVLEDRGYILRNEISGKYRLSLKLYTLSHTHSPIEQLRQSAQNTMQELANETGQACHLSVPYNNQLMVVSQMKSPNPVSLSIAEGTLFPLFQTVSGRVLLAHFSEKERNSVLSQDEKYIAAGEEGRVQVRQDLERIRSEGFHSADSDLTLGVTDCAAFIGQAETGLMAAIAVSSLTSSLTQPMSRQRIEEAVLKAAYSMKQKMGAR